MGKSCLKRPSVYKIHDVYYSFYFGVIVIDFMDKHGNQRLNFASISEWENQGGE